MSVRAVLLRPSPSLSRRFSHTIAGRVAEVIGRPVRVGPVFRVDAKAYDASRKQYRGEDILRMVCAGNAGDTVDVVVLVDEDCYGAGLTFVFGQAMMHKGCAFVACARLHGSLGAKPESERRFALRLVKEIVHELGHTRGLLHCPRPGCVMHFSSTLDDTDRKGPAYCPSCRTKLKS
jgi:archaemetzincin